MTDERGGGGQGAAPLFACRGVRVWVEGREVVKGVDLEVGAGEVHALMGPNGSGKSSLAAALMGHPGYRLEGEVTLAGEDVTGLSPDERARRGMFLGFQSPVAVPGVAVGGFMQAAVRAVRGVDTPVRELRRELFDALETIGLAPGFAGRSLNDGFSGGEKKRLEVVQMLLLRPRFALLDEVDSGLDIDALRVVSRGVRRAADDGAGLLLVTHYKRILDHVTPDRVHVLVDGRIVRSGGPEQAKELEERGYEGLGAASARASGG